MDVLQTPLFRKNYKKIHGTKKQIVNEAIKAIMENPHLGTEKKQDLAGIFVYKFKIDLEQYLLAYRFDPTTLTLIMLGVHENFYRDLKRHL